MSLLKLKDDKKKNPMLKDREPKLICNRVLEALCDDLTRINDSSERGLDLVRYFTSASPRQKDVPKEERPVCSNSMFIKLINKFPHYKKRLNNILYSNILKYTARQHLGEQYIRGYQMLNENIMNQTPIDDTKKR